MRSARGPGRAPGPGRARGLEAARPLRRARARARDRPRARAGAREPARRPEGAAVRASARPVPAARGRLFDLGKRLGRRNVEQAPEPRPKRAREGSGPRARERVPGEAGPPREGRRRSCRGRRIPPARARGRRGSASASGACATGALGLRGGVGGNLGPAGLDLGHGLGRGSDRLDAGSAISATGSGDLLGLGGRLRLCRRLEGLLCSGLGGGRRDLERLRVHVAADLRQLAAGRDHKLDVLAPEALADVPEEHLVGRVGDRHDGQAVLEAVGRARKSLACSSVKRPAADGSTICSRSVTKSRPFWPASRRARSTSEMRPRSVRISPSRLPVLTPSSRALSIVSAGRRPARKMRVPRGASGRSRSGVLTGSPLAGRWVPGSSPGD